MCRLLISLEAAARLELGLPQAPFLGAEQVGLRHHPGDMATQYQHRHGADLVLHQQGGDPLVPGAPVNGHHRRRHDVPDPVLPSAVVLLALAVGMPVHAALRRMALSGIGCPGFFGCGGIVVGGLVLGNAKLTG